MPLRREPESPKGVPDRVLPLGPPGRPMSAASSRPSSTPAASTSRSRAGVAGIARASDRAIAQPVCGQIGFGDRPRRDAPEDARSAHLAVRRLALDEPAATQALQLRAHPVGVQAEPAAIVAVSSGSSDARSSSIDARLGRVVVRQ